MKAILLSKENEDYTRSSIEFMTEFNKLHPDNRLENIDSNTPEGSRLVSLYGLNQLPAILIITNDGQLINLWQGNLPLKDDIFAYLRY